MKKNDKCRICRRAGEKLFLKGEKCNTPNCVFAKKSYAPGLGGAKARVRRGSDYSIQLKEKQKARAIYGVSEKQMQNYFAKARKNRSATGENLIQLLEGRIDNVVYRAGWARSRNEARQIVSHSKVSLNGRYVKTPSLQVKISDKIKLNTALDKETAKKDLPAWISAKSGTEIEVKSLPQKEELLLINEQLIIEFYSR
jgi:small subunit ribosomal protein S4